MAETNATKPVEKLTKKAAAAELARLAAAIRAAEGAQCGASSFIRRC